MLLLPAQPRCPSVSAALPLEFGHTVPNNSRTVVPESVRDGPGVTQQPRGCRRGSSARSPERAAAGPRERLCRCPGARPGGEPWAEDKRLQPRGAGARISCARPPPGYLPSQAAYPRNTKR